MFEQNFPVFVFASAVLMLTTPLRADSSTAEPPFWKWAPTPLMLGNNLPDTDEWTLSMITNDEVLAVNQDVLGSPARRVWQTKGTEIWLKNLNDRSVAVGLFNRGAALANIELNWNDVGLVGQQTLRDLWLHKDLGTFETKYAAQVPSHGVVLLSAKR